MRACKQLARRERKKEAGKRVFTGGSWFRMNSRKKATGKTAVD
jgi:hypothetical protein